MSLQKELKYKYIWTVNGVRYRKKDNDNHATPIKDKNDLDNLSKFHNFFFTISIKIPTKY